MWKFLRGYVTIIVWCKRTVHECRKRACTERRRSGGRINWKKDKNYDEAFKDAHTLKGVSDNLGLGLLNETVVPLTEELRNPPYNEAKITGFFDQTQANYKTCIKLIDQLTQ